LEFFDRRLNVLAPACKVTLASVAVGVASPEVIEPQHMKTDSNQAGRELPHGPISKDLLVVDGMAQQHGSHPAGIRQSRLVIAEKTPLTATEVKRRHRAHALDLDNPTPIRPKLENQAKLQPMIRSHRIRNTRGQPRPNCGADDTKRCRCKRPYTQIGRLDIA